MKVEKKKGFYVNDNSPTEYFYTELLCTAIIKQAADDYRRYYRNKDRYGVNYICTFFDSDWFKFLTAEKVSGSYIKNKLHEECSKKYKYVL